MGSARLYQDQVERLRKSGNGMAVIRFAVKRYRRGDFVIQKRETHQNTPNVLQLYAMRTKFEGISDEELRQIIDAHLSNPVDRSKEIARLDKLIAGMFKNLPPYSIENPESFGNP